MAIESRNDKRIKRHERVRKTVFGTPERPRMAVYRSNKNISVQIIDDVNHKTLVAASSLDKEFEGYGGNKEAAKKVGEMIGKKAAGGRSPVGRTKRSAAAARAMSS